MTGRWDAILLPSRAPDAGGSRAHRGPRRARAATARCRSAARRTCPRAGPTAATAAAAATSSLRCDDSLRDLQSFRRRAHFRAERGGHGQGAQRTAPTATPLDRRACRPAPQVERWDGTPLRPRPRPARRSRSPRGGAGGRGNKRFATPTRQAPRLAERGCRARRARSSCSSSCSPTSASSGCRTPASRRCCARLTRAQPKVADYPFTTLEPVLGTLDADDRQLVIADIPGLIEGASDGAGLGHDFLAHVERTRLLVHVLDLAPLDGSDPAANHAVIEARAGRARRRGSPSCRASLALSKADLVPPEAAEAAAARVARGAARRRRSLVTSRARRGQGLDELRARAAAPRARGRAACREGAGEDERRRVRGLPPGARGARSSVERTGAREFRVSGDGGRAADRAPRPRERGGAGATSRSGCGAWA